MTVELLKFEPEGPRTAQMFVALTTAARDVDIDVKHTTAYEGQSDWLMLWGPGAPSRWPAMLGQLKRGRKSHVIAWDGAYWSRDRKLRVSIDAAHPDAWVLHKKWANDRWQGDPAPVANANNVAGPIIVAGIGEKARTQYGAGVVDAWEAEMMACCRARWPGRAIIYRAKDRTAAPIESLLTGASLLVTWHSNVAVDAIRFGIPVVCHEGAASAVCYGSSDLRDRTLRISSDPDPLLTPLPDPLRDQFLANIAYFQWAPNEAGQCWQFLQEMLCAS